jgi:hypothetical protein
LKHLCNRRAKEAEERMRLEKEKEAERVCPSHSIMQHRQHHDSTVTASQQHHTVPRPIGERRGGGEEERRGGREDQSSGGEREVKLDSLAQCSNTDDFGRLPPVLRIK